MRLRRLLGYVPALLLACAFLAQEASAQDGRPTAALSVDLIERLFQAGFTTDAVLGEMRGQCLDFRPEAADVQRRLRLAGADDAFFRELHTFCFRAPSEPLVATAAQPLQPVVPAGGPSRGAAAFRSALVPGLGQLSSGRPAMGAVFLTAAGGVLAAGALSESVTVFCTAPTLDRCAPEHIAEEKSESRLALGLVGFAAVAAVAAIEAYVGTDRGGAAQAAYLEPGSTRTAARFAMPSLHASASRVEVDLVRVRF
jgi:hypothetical protein